MKTSPHYKTLYLYGIDSAGNEFSLDHDKKFFFKPFNQRGFYHALYNTIQYKGSKNTLIPLVKIANRFNPLVNGLRLYELTCSCTHFVELETIDLSMYLEKYCKRRLTDEVLL